MTLHDCAIYYSRQGYVLVCQHSNAVRLQCCNMYEPGWSKYTFDVSEKKLSRIPNWDRQQVPRCLGLPLPAYIVHPDVDLGETSQSHNVYSAQVGAH